MNRGANPGVMVAVQYAFKRSNWRTLEEIVCSMSGEDLIDFARARAQRESDSSSYEGIPLDAEELFRDYLKLYRKWRAEPVSR